MHVSPAKLRANRENARKSRGPKTPEGKERSKMNALKHGFTARQVVLDPIEAELFRPFAEAITADLAPANQLELALVDHIISSAWRLRRAIRIESDHLKKLMRNPGQSLGEQLAETGHKALFAFSVHETKIERSLYRAIDRLQALREKPIPPPVEPETKDIDWIEGATDTIRTVENLNDDIAELEQLIEEKKQNVALLKEIEGWTNQWHQAKRMLSQLEEHPESASLHEVAEGAQNTLWQAEERLKDLGAPIPSAN